MSKPAGMQCNMESIEEEQERNVGEIMRRYHGAAALLKAYYAYPKLVEALKRYQKGWERNLTEAAQNATQLLAELGETT